MDAFNIGQLFRELNDIKVGVEGIHSRLDTLNGRTRSLETKVGVMWVAWAVVATMAASAWATFLGWFGTPKLG